jgi:hypothetical protein
MLKYCKSLGRHIKILEICENKIPKMNLILLVNLKIKLESSCRK